MRIIGRSAFTPFALPLVWRLIFMPARSGSFLPGGPPKNANGPSSSVPLSNHMKTTHPLGFAASSMFTLASRTVNPRNDALSWTWRAMPLASSTRSYAAVVDLGLQHLEPPLAPYPQAAS